MNWNIIRQVVGHFDRIARQDRCPYCGRATGGLVPRLGSKGRGMVTGNSYQAGEQPEPVDVDICECDSGIGWEA